MKNNFKDGYFKWLYDNTQQFNINNNISRLTLPYLDRNNDCTEIFIKFDGNRYIITDDSETLSELYLSNFLRIEKLDSKTGGRSYETFFWKKYKPETKSKRSKSADQAERNCAGEYSEGISLR